jgi:hypothetical protein
MIALGFYSVGNHTIHKTRRTSPQTQLLRARKQSLRQLLNLLWESRRVKQILTATAVDHGCYTTAALFISVKF